MVIKGWMKKIKRHLTERFDFHKVNRMMDAHIQQVEDRIAELTQLRRQLKALRRSCSSDRTVEQCGILQNLTT